MAAGARLTLTGGRLVPVSDTPVQPDETTTGDTDLETLVGEWLTVPDAAERLGVPLSRVRARAFVDESGPRPELRGTFTVLADGGMDDTEIIEWLFTPDATLPVEGAPIDALRAGHKTEIRRRAQELAF